MNTEHEIITLLKQAGSVSAPEKLTSRIETRIHLLPQPLAVGFMGTMALRFAVAIAALLALGTGMAVAHKSRPGDVLFPVKQFVQQVVSFDYAEDKPEPSPTPSPPPASVFMEPAHAVRTENRQAVLGKSDDASKAAELRPDTERRERGRRKRNSRH